MENSPLTLDRFLSRFQLLRPQMTRHSLNQRQAAVRCAVCWWRAISSPAIR
ncbi:Hypothetical nudix hydrolase YeaB [Cronobacter dublinensis 582]|nr:Hypothetical nudix hydrolase YeaB [Cronobacter dublinensis 582]